jgi:outer membrane lipoprotein-sorting protein
MKSKKRIVGSVVLAGTLLFGGYYYGDRVINADNPSVTKQQLEIKEKMQNAIDYYTFAKGSFFMKKSSGEVQFVDFEVHEGAEPGSHIMIRNENNEVIKTATADAQYIIITNDKERSYIMASKSADNKKPEGPRKKVIDGQTFFTYRNDPASPADAGSVTFPQQLAFWLDTEKNNFKIAGEELFLNRNATVIEGKVIEGKKGDQFKMLVDTETGILLHFLVTNNAGEIIQEIKVQEIEIGKNKDTEPFKLTIPEGYTDRSSKAN